MAKHRSTDSAEALFAERAEAERRLLRREQKAERRLAAERDSLAAEQAKLRKAEARVERRRAAVRDADAELARRQADRAAGPAGAPADRHTPGSAADPAESDD